MPLNIDPMNQAVPQMNSDDFTNLAKVAAPQMMPNAPLGAGASAGYNYGLDKLRQNDLIAQATQQAQKEAALRASAADEYSAGAPGRMAEINTGNINAQAGQQAAQQMSDSGLTVQEKIASKVATVTGERQKELEGKSALWSQLAGAKGDPTKVKNILNMYGDQATLFGKDLKDAPPDQLSEMSEGIVKGIMENPKNMTAMAVAAGKNAATVAASRGKGIEAEQLRSDTQKALAKFKLDNPQNFQQEKARLYNKIGQNGMDALSDNEKEEFNTMIQMEAINATARVSTAPPDVSVQPGVGIVSTAKTPLNLPQATKSGTPSPSAAAPSGTPPKGAIAKVMNGDKQIGWRMPDRSVVPMQ